MCIATNYHIVPQSKIRLNSYWQKKIPHCLRLYGIGVWCPANALPKRPVQKKKAETKPLTFGPTFSTTVPKKPAESPKNKIAKEKVQVISAKEKPICAINGLVSTLKAYTLPIEI